MDVDLHIGDGHGSQAKFLEKVHGDVLELGIVDSFDALSDLLCIFVVVTKEVLKFDWLPLNDNFACDVVSWKPDYAIRDIEGDARVVEDTGKREVDGGDEVTADIEGALVNMLAEEKAHVDGLGVGEEFLVLLMVIDRPKSSAIRVKT